MITTFIFDIGNVLADFRWKSYIKELGFDEETKRKVSEATVLSPVWQEFDRGLLSKEEIYNKMYQIHPECETQIRIFFENAERMVIEYDYSVKWIQSLKEAGYNIYVLSNYAEPTFEYAKKNFNFLKYIDGGVISFEVKSIKPEKKIYNELIMKYKILPENAIFLDDNQDNVRMAEKLGFHSIQFVNFEEANQTIDKIISQCKH